MYENQSGNWEHFKDINRRRRAVKDFLPMQIADEVIREILEEALLAPSSANAQPYEIHWIRSGQLKDQVAAACNGQRAAQQASTLFVIVSSTAIAKNSLAKYAGHTNNSPELSEKSKAFNLGIVKKMSGFLKSRPL